MTKVTVLVAVYNAEAFLSRCIASLLSQTLRDIQVVCIDDCSTDSSLSLLESYREKDGRIEVIHLDENGGQAHARNQGLKRARGEYVCMLDADDWYSPDALEKGVSVFEEHPYTDTVLFQCLIAHEQSDGFTYSPYPLKPFDCLSGREACMLSIDDWQIHGIYMVRRAIHQRYPYDESTRLYSDDNTTHLHYLASREVRQCEGIYYYLLHDNSHTHQISVKIFDRIKAKENMLRTLVPLLSDRRVEQMLTTQLWLVVVDSYMFYYLYGRDLSAADRRRGLAEMHRVWRYIDRTLLTPSKVHKFGYWPMPTWWLFRCQEWLYFTLRGLLGRNRRL